MKFHFSHRFDMSFGKTEWSFPRGHELELFNNRLETGQLSGSLTIESIRTTPLSWTVKKHNPKNVKLIR